jgi:hypothetical protein
LEILQDNGIESLERQTEFMAQCLSSWFEASGRFEDPRKAKLDALHPGNVVYQGRVLVSVITLIPAMIWKLKQEGLPVVSEKSSASLTKWLGDVALRANLVEKKAFISKEKFRARGYLGSGGIGRFRDSLWAVVVGHQKLTSTLKPEKIAAMAEKSRETVFKALGRG